MRRIDYKDLEVFSVVAREGSIRAAALQLNLSQPSVSGRMNRLERCLGMELLHRSTRGAALTEAGHRLLPYIDRGKDLMDEMFAALGASASATSLRVVADASMAPWAASFVCGAVDHLPVELSVRIGSHDKVRSAVAGGEADLGFGPAGRCPDGLSTEPFFADPLAFVVDPSHPLAAAGTPSLRDLTGCDIAVVDCGEASDAVVRRLRSCRIPPHRIRSVSPSSSAVMLARHCGHVAVSSRSSLDSALRQGVVVEVEPAGIALRPIDVQLVFRSTDADEPVVRIVRDAVAQARRARRIPDPHGVGSRAPGDLAR